MAAAASGGRNDPVPDAAQTPACDAIHNAGPEERRKPVPVVIGSLIVGGDAEEDHASSSTASRRASRSNRSRRLTAGWSDGDRLWVRVRRLGRQSGGGRTRPSGIEPRPVDQFEEPEVAREEVVGALRVANVGKVWERAHGWAMMGSSKRVLERAILGSRQRGPTCTLSPPDCASALPTATSRPQTYRRPMLPIADSSSNTTIRAVRSGTAAGARRRTRRRCPDERNSVTPLAVCGSNVGANEDLMDLIREGSR